MGFETTSFDSHERDSTRLVFSKNSVINAELLVDGRARYIISTLDNSAMKTKILDADTRQQLVSIKKRTLLPDKITCANRHGGQEQKLSDVLRNHKLEDGFPVHLIRTEQGDFYWKIHPVHRLALFSMSDPVHPVAYREAVAEPIATFALVIKREVDSISDYIISTFLVLEQRLRTDEKGTSTAEAIAAYDRTIWSNYSSATT